MAEQRHQRQEAEIQKIEETRYRKIGVLQQAGGGGVGGGGVGVPRPVPFCTMEVSGGNGVPGLYYVHSTHITCFQVVFCNEISQSVVRIRPYYRHNSPGAIKESIVKILILSQILVKVAFFDI